jgi:hypothetical protein
MSDLQRTLTLELNVKKKSSDLAGLTQDSNKLKDGLEKVDKQAKVTMTGIDKMDKATDKLKGGLKELASSAFLLGSAGAGIEKLVMNFVRLAGAVQGLKGISNIASSLKSMTSGDMLLQASRMTGMAPKAMMGAAAKYAMPTMVGGAALGAGAAIVSGVNAADNWLTSKGSKPWLGHGGWDRDGEGKRYAWSPGKIGDQIEHSLIGGGRFNKRGDLISNDELLSRADKRMVDDSDRMQREVGIAEAARGVTSSQTEYRNRSFSLTAGIPFQGMGRSGRNRFSSGLASAFGGEEASMRLQYGRVEGSERFRAMQSMLTEQGRGLGTSTGLAEAGLAESNALINRQAGAFAAAKGKSVGQVGGKENAGEALSKDRSIIEEGNRLIELETKGLEAVKAKQQARMGELSTIRDQSRALSEMYAADSAAAQASYNRSKQSLGAMTPTEGRITLSGIKKAREKGFGALTPEMRSRVQGFLPEEFNQFAEGQANKLKVGGKSFDEIMKGSIPERRISEAAQRADEFKNQTVKLEQQIDVQAKIDEEALANILVNRLQPLLKEVETTVGRVGERVKALEEQAAGAGALRSNVAGGKK